MQFKSFLPIQMLIICGDMNAQISSKFSFTKVINRNGTHLLNFAEEHSLIIGNTANQKPRCKLWTWKSPKGDLTQVDYCLYRKRWRNSFGNCQVHSSSNTIGSDHRIVTATIKLTMSVKTLFLKENVLASYYY